MSLGTLGLAFLAGALSVLSSCVLPLLPIMLGSAASEHRLAPAALAAGLSLSFVVIGLFVATVGFTAGLDTGFFRLVSAVLLIAVGTLLLVPRLGAQAAAAGGPVSNWVEGQFGGFAAHGLGGQFLLGLLLGAVWSPCVGPTLGAASLLASQGQDLPRVTLTMAIFGVGAALPLVLFGLLSRATLMRARDGLMSAATLGKSLRGAAFIVIGVANISGADKRLEAALVAASPQWLTDLTTYF